MGLTLRQGSQPFVHLCQSSVGYELTLMGKDIQPPREAAPIYLRTMIWRSGQLWTIVLIESGRWGHWSGSQPASTKHHWVRYTCGFKKREKETMANREYRPYWKGPPGPPPQPVMASLASQSSDILRETESLSFHVRLLILNVVQTLGRPNNSLM